MIKFTASGNGVIFSVRVQPRASRSCIAGEAEGTLRIRLAAAPVDGEANEELMNLLAKLLDIPRRQVEILSGLRSKNKVVRISGISGERFEKLIGDS
ncbi:MAG: DUF167 domain-containing protein [Blastocatellia bacterium]|nr:DUF167 domain-containing protein [Blastocatellia bacterium]